MTISAQDPIWFAGLALAVPLGFLAVRWFRAMGAARRWVSILLRVLLLGVACAALAGVTMLRQVDRVCTIAVLDVSGSVRELFDPGVDQSGGRLSLWERVAPILDAGSSRRRAEDTSALVVFADDAAVLVSPTTAPAGRFLPVTPTLSEIVTGEGTNIDRAIRLASALSPPSSSLRVVLVSDGVPTSGDALSAASHIAAASAVRYVPIDTIALNYQISHDVLVQSVETPSLAPSEATVPVRVTFNASAAATGELELSREGEAVDLNGDQTGLRRRISIPPGRTTLTFPVRLPQGRVHRFIAQFYPDSGSDTIAANNRAESVTLTPGRSSVLIIDGAGGGDVAGMGATLYRTLRSAGIEAEMIAPAAVSPDLLWLQRFDLIVLQDVAADELREGVANTIAEYVTRFGGGLTMIGGPDSFGAGGWKGTPIEPILPVALQLPERAVSPSAAVIIILDRSGSMRFSVMGTGRTQQMIANEGAVAAIETLDRTDLLGVVAFSDEAQVLVPLGPNRDPAATAAKVRGIFPDGGTNLAPALRSAYKQLQAVTAETKHVIVLSDGVSQDQAELPDIASRMRKDGIRVSTIAVGDGADAPTMAGIAEKGDGTFYFVTDPHLLPRVFVKAIRVVRSPQIRETPFVPVILSTGSPIVDGLTSPIPPLAGLVLTEPRREPTVTNAIVTPEGEPVLAHWVAGIGNVAAFTSDASEWAAAWLQWPGYTRLWTQLVRTLARPQADRGQELSVWTEGDRVQFRVNALGPSGAPRDGLSLSGWLHSRNGQRVSVSLAQSGPGEYSGSAPALDAGTHIVTLTPSLNGTPMPPLIGGVSVPRGSELRQLQSNPEFLRSLSESSGGRVISIDSSGDAEAGRVPDLFDRGGMKPSIARVPLWPQLMLALIAIYLCDVGCRRLAWDRLLAPALASARQSLGTRRSQDRSAQAARSVDQLRRSEERRARDRVPVSESRALSDEDARRIVVEQAKRRKRAVSPPAGATPDLPAASEGDDLSRAQTKPKSEQRHEAGPTDEPGASSLLEAKRRARKRIEEQQDDGST